MLSPLLALLSVAVGANPYLDEGRRLSRTLHYPEAVQKLKLAVEVPSSSTDERREAYDLLARALLAMGDAAKAKDAYAALLQKDPHAPRPNAGPKILDAFDEAKERVYPRGFVSLKLLPAPAGWLSVECVDPWQKVAQVQLYSARGELELTGQALELTDHVARVQLPQLGPGERLRYYVEAGDENGKSLARLGELDEPLTLTAPEVVGAAMPQKPEAVVEAPPPSARPPRWVGYLLAGLAVAVAGTGAAFAFAADTDTRAGVTTRFAADKIAFDDRAARRALAANVLFGAGAAVGIGAIVVIWIGE